MQPMGYGGGGYGGGPPGYGGPPGQGGPPGYGAPPPQAAYAGQQQATYEFSNIENLTIENVAKFARMWGVISLITGVLILIMGVGIAFAAGAVAAASASSGSRSGGGNPFGNAAAVSMLGIALVPSAIVSIIGGVFYLRSGAALKSVVDTQGDDIRLLTEAVRSLSTAFKIEAIAMAVGFVVGLVIGAMGRAGGNS